MMTTTMIAHELASTVIGCAIWGTFWGVVIKVDDIVQRRRYNLPRR